MSFYSLSRSAGLVLRYLSDAFRAIRQSVPDEFKDEELKESHQWLGELVRQVDSSLLDEWEELSHPDPERHAEAVHALPPTPRSVLANRRAFTVLVRNELFRRVQLASLEHYDALGELDASAGFDADAWADAMDPYFEEHGELPTGAAARSPALLVNRRRGRTPRGDAGSLCSAPGVRRPGR